MSRLAHFSVEAGWLLLWHFTVLAAFGFLGKSQSGFSPLLVYTSFPTAHQPSHLSFPLERFLVAAGVQFSLLSNFQTLPRCCALLASTSKGVVSKC
uniref:Putative secreted protein n=1 Tax=Ixodes ricinus TaxID=34613 RepID=A0A6B0UDF3_IXORI